MKKKTLLIVTLFYILAFIFGLAIGKYFATNKAKAEGTNDVEIIKIEDKKQEKENKEFEKNQNNNVENTIRDTQKQETKPTEEITTDYEKKNKEKIKEVMAKKTRKVAYLTFDDGPSKDVTLSVLEILKQNNIKGTFFVIGNMVKINPDVLKKINEEGHAIGNHTFTHNYKSIYSSPSVMLKEIDDTDKLIKSIVGEGYNNRFFRFPGGSFKRPVDIKKSIVDNGYIYIDWNCLTGDAEGKMMSVEKQYERFLSTAKNKNSLVILMHDGIGKNTTPEVLIKVINYLKENGYEFDVLR